MTQASYEQQIIDKVQKCIDLARVVIPLGSNFCGDEFPVPEVEFYNKGRAAGKAVRTADGRLIVQFNREACEKYLDEMLNDVVPHEVAHIVCYINPALGRRHDGGWKRVCKTLGGTASGTHSMALTPAKQVSRMWLYKDTAGKIREVTTRLHNRMRREGIRYRYRDNGGLISAACYIGNINNQPKEETKMSNETVATNETVNETPRSQDRFRKSEGRPSKAAQAREIIAELGTEDRKAVVSAIQERLGFTRQMARHYFYCESRKLNSGE